MVYLVVEWTKSGKEILDPPQLEALSSSKVIADHGVREGKAVKMQWNGSLWDGIIVSIHSKLGTLLKKILF